ncbi:BlaI/MecI/CopY family transcriptional regulator [Roseiconus nitratireducens]|uniref:BlaI/MecI/CopY family transcriptional regulator n=1 Tax=Roseiconus nitratireducens TaxID=2605748 RepID=A0A5M6D5C1_9BACT|nr:BlaI/MecI/CopY family transcriptional regulator [Roseiconus nitratireducens]KAA5542704.1 BlaI/MecI/CopY family transcriptional regulator [Roseiconus nitratireducens]
MRLTPGELKVMRLLWKHGEMKPPEIGERYKPPIKDAALRACLAVLLEKGHVERRREGRAYVYRARTKQHRAYKTMLRELLDNFCDGSARQLMMNLAEQESLSEDDLQEIKRLTKSTQTPGKKGKR